MTPKELRARFREAVKERDKILAKSAPLRAKRDKVLEKVAAAEAEAKLIAEQYLEIEAPAYDLNNEIASISRQLGGKTAEE